MTLLPAYLRPRIVELQGSRYELRPVSLRSEYVNGREQHLYDLAGSGTRKHQVDGYEVRGVSSQTVHGLVVGADEDARWSFYRVGAPAFGARSGEYSAGTAIFDEPTIDAALARAFGLAQGSSYRHENPMSWTRFSNPMSNPAKVVEYRGWRIEHDPAATQLGYRVSTHRAAPGFGFEDRPGKGRKISIWYLYHPDDPNDAVKTTDSLAHAKAYIDNYIG